MDKKALHSIWFGNEITKVAGAKAPHFVVESEDELAGEIEGWMEASLYPYGQFIGSEESYSNGKGKCRADVSFTFTYEIDTHWSDDAAYVEEFMDDLLYGWSSESTFNGRGFPLIRPAAWSKVSKFFEKYLKIESDGGKWASDAFRRSFGIDVRGTTLAVYLDMELHGELPYGFEIELPYEPQISYDMHKYKDADSWANSQRYVDPKDVEALKKKWKEAQQIALANVAMNQWTRGYQRGGPSITLDLKAYKTTKEAESAGMKALAKLEAQVVSAIAKWAK